MEPRKDLLWKVLLAMVALLALIAIGWGYGWHLPRAGFTEAYLPKPEKLDYRPAKTVWDWLGLLVVPAFLAIAGLLFTHWKDTRDRRIGDERLREDVLQGYLDRMAELMLREKLGASPGGDSVRVVARSRTLAALRRLDGGRKGYVLSFLYESGLIVAPKDAREISVELRDADLRGADLRDTYFLDVAAVGADLRGADLRDAHFIHALLADTKLDRADLREASFIEACFRLAKLNGADLRGADLHKAEFDDADLGGADLRGAKHLTQAQIDSADGNMATRLPEELKLPTHWAPAATRGGPVAGGPDRSARPDPKRDSGAESVPDRPDGGNPKV